MYAEVEEEKSLSKTRVEQGLEVGEDIIATACPWCHTMLSNATKDLQKEDTIKSRDIAELLVEALNLLEVDW